MLKLGFTCLFKVFEIYCKVNVSIISTFKFYRYMTQCSSKHLNVLNLSYKDNFSLTLLTSLITCPLNVNRFFRMVIELSFEMVKIRFIFVTIILNNYNSFYLLNLHLNISNSILYLLSKALMRHKCFFYKLKKGLNSSNCILL